MIKPKNLVQKSQLERNWDKCIFSVWSLKFCSTYWFDMRLKLDNLKMKLLQIFPVHVFQVVTLPCKECFFPSKIFVVAVAFLLLFSLNWTQYWKGYFHDNELVCLRGLYTNFSEICQGVI